MSQESFYMFFFFFLKAEETKNNTSKKSNNHNHLSKHNKIIPKRPLTKTRPKITSEKAYIFLKNLQRAPLGGCTEGACGENSARKFSDATGSLSFWLGGLRLVQSNQLSAGDRNSSASNNDCHTQ